MASYRYASRKTADGLPFDNSVDNPDEFLAQDQAKSELHVVGLVEMDRVTVWIFSNKRRGIFKYRIPPWLVIAGPAALAVLLALGSIALDRHISSRTSISELGNSSYEQALHQRLEDLRENVSRVRKYEDQLKLRAAALDTVLKETKSLDSQLIKSSSSRSMLIPRKTRHERSMSGLGGGMGGGVDFPLVSPSESKALRNLTPHPPREKNLLDLLDNRIDELRWLPVGNPVLGEYTSGFGYRTSPFSGRGQFHEGIDFSTDKRSAVVATADGVVREAGRKGRYGLALVVDHGNGLETLYGHLSELKVKAGDRVCRGERIGLVGSTGSSTGPHLHYEIRRDEVPLNPISFIELASTLKVLAK